MTLHSHLAARLTAGFRQLSRALAGLSDAEAAEGADPSWHRYRFGEGLDGSIRGIVSHLAAWKRAAAEGLEGGDFASARHSPPGALSWDDLIRELEVSQTRLVFLLERLPPEELERRVTWEGQSMTAAEVFTHLIEHDHYHAGQVNLLRQQRGHRFPEGS